MTTYKDTDLREALRRKYADTPQLPSDFMNRMQQASQKNRQRSSFFIRHSPLVTRRFAAVFSIAAVLLIAFLLWPESHEETTIQQDVKFVIAEATSQPVPQPIIEEKKEEVLAVVQPTKQPVKEYTRAARKQSTPVEPVQAGPELSSESLPHQEESTQPSPGEEKNIMRACYGEVDSRTQLYTAEIELEQSTHQRQKAYEKEMKQRALKLLLYINDREDELTDGTINTQKS